MSLKDILVYVDEFGQADQTVAAACSLAMRHESHLTGLSIDWPPEIPGFAAIEIPPSAMEILQRQRKESLDKSRKTFEEKVRSFGLTDSSGWVSARGRPLDALAVRSRYADITVVPQTDPDSQRGDDDLVDELIMASGRPVLVVPYIGAPREFGRKVIVAWNASREAARAVSDAMPILEKAESVEIFAVEPKGMGDIPGADIAGHLARHGIRISASKTAGLELDAGNILLNQISESGADLVIMGAYGHSRMRELVLGGVTQQMLGHMTVPVLFSH